MENNGDGFWAVVELMGHVKMVGYVTEEERFGAKLGCIDIPEDGEGQEAFTQYFGSSSVYRITPVAEELARQQKRDLAHATREDRENLFPDIAARTRRDWHDRLDEIAAQNGGYKT